MDLFSPSTTGIESFATAVDLAERSLTEHGYEVTRLRSAPLFARLHVHDTTGVAIEVDLGVNWRAHSPIVLDVGPVLAESDAVAGKLSAVYSRREVRDFLDLDAIRASGRYTDAELLSLGAEHDDGFDRAMFAQSLSQVVRFDSSEAEEYGYRADDFSAVQQRIHAWAPELRETT